MHEDDKQLKSNWKDEVRIAKRFDQVQGQVLGIISELEYSCGGRLEWFVNDKSGTNLRYRNKNRALHPYENMTERKRTGKDGPEHVRTGLTSTITIAS